MKTRLEKQVTLAGQISRTHENLRKLGQANITLGAVEARIENLNAKWKKFCDDHTEIEVDATADDKKMVYFSEDFFSSTEETYLAQKGKLLDCLRALNRSTPSISRADSESVVRQSLPKINIPKFSGNFTDWLNFRDLFKSMVIDAPLSEIEKMHYLKTTLTKEAASVIASVPSTAGNFDLAWELLTSRYDNIRLLTTAQIASLFSLPSLTAESSAELKILYNGTTNAVGALKALKRPINQCDDFVVHMTVEKLDIQSRREWEASVGSKKIPSTFVELKTFLENRICSMEALESTTKSSESSASPKSGGSNSSRQSKKTPSSSQQSVKSHVANNSSSKQKCTLCQQGHFVLFCEAFREKSPEDRKSFVIASKLCLNCLGHHYVRDCRSQKTCQTCKGKHHSTLHEAYASAPPFSTPRPGGSEESSSTTSHIVTHNVHTARATTARVLLATALVRVSASNNEKLLVRALIDQGSEATFVSESLVQQLNLPRSSASVLVNGIGANTATMSRGAVSLCLSSRLASNFECKVRALIIPKLTSYKPPSVTLSSHWEHLNGLPMADPDFRSLRPIELLIGADVYAQLILDGVRKGVTGSPVAQKTHFGWVLSGLIDTQVTHDSVLTSLQVSLDSSLSHSLQRFWEQEEMSSSPINLTQEEADCERHFLETHSRRDDGRYVVRLPLRKPIENLGDSLSAATYMLKRMESRFSRDSALHKEYSAFLREYQELNHMELVQSPKHDWKKCFYLPHHGVVRESSSTTKLRVVFNGSQKTTARVSLNEHLHVGPKLLPELVHVLLRWRAHEIVFSSDMAKMYRQVLVHEDDRDFQRIVWREDPSSSINTYRLRTVTYGLTCAPFLAIRVIHQLAHDEEARFPIGAAALKTDVYVDDVLSGADDVDTALAKRDEIIELLKAGGFQLRKWTSNSPALLANLATEATATASSIEWQPETFHMLGLSWQSCSDSFVFHLNSNESPEPLTKRNVLSRIAQLFDPLGWLSPVSILAKIFMQSLWLLKLEWDDALPAEQTDRWNRIYSDLPAISNFRIPRWIGKHTTTRALELHGFADASERAYAAVLYLRVTRGEETSVVLVSAKTKVAPVKQVSLPRLELCAANLVARHSKTVLETLSLDCPVHLWSDSTIALAWIRDHPTKWKTYVANRVAEIQLALPTAIWHHVDSKSNPADCASRGVLASELQHHPLWWSGPRWLKENALKWPRLLEETPTELPDKRLTSLAVSTEKREPMDLLTRYSNLTKLLRVTARCCRFLSNRPSKEKKPLTLSPAEIDESLLRLIRIEQLRHFENDIRTLQLHASVANGPLLSLNAFLDEKGLLRVGGRLKNAMLDPDEKYPYILPRDSPLTTLLVRQHHEQTLHGGVQLTLATLRRRYWLIGGRSTVKAVIHRCLKCKRFRAATATQLMGNLPKLRVTKARPFLHSGVDYAGPISLRTTKGRGHKAYKRYISVFVCFATRAVHLEAVSDYTTASFIAAYRRFISRRGKCAVLTSDCGTNLIGADAELRALFASSSSESEKIARILSNDGTLWKFNPPAAPHFGGLWEAAVKSVKHHLRRVIGDCTLTFEEMSTLLAQIEACLNSRPLQAISDDPDDLAALTPAHFLIGEPLTAVPEPSLTDLPTSRLSRWQLIQQMQRHFWNRWSKEYLLHLQARKKWQKPQASLKLGDLVLIKNELLPPTKWSLGRIIKLHPGEDEKNRVATVKTATSTFTRPIVKLCPLLTNAELQ